eukprot:384559_1
MEEAILFRSMVESLSTKEFNTFSQTLFTVFNPRDLLTKCISHLLIYQNRNAMNTQYSKNINNILIKIIRSRNNNVNKNERNKDENKVQETDNSSTNTKVSISDLPNPLIANCSSYLSFKEVFKFIRCNRHVYVSCQKNTNWITEMTRFGWIRKYIRNNFGSRQSRSVRLSRFNMVQKLSLGYFDFAIMRWNKNDFVFKNIQHLYFELNSGGNFGEWLKKYGDILKTMKQLHHLHLDVSRLSDISHLLSLITLNDTIKFLYFRLCYQIFDLPEDVSTLIQQEIYNKFDFGKRMKCLQGIQMHDYLFLDDIIFFDVLLRKISGQLQSYHIDCRNHNDGDSFWDNLQSNYTFPKLKEICIFLEKKSQNEQSFEFLKHLQTSLSETDLLRFSISLSLNGVPNFNDNDYSKFNTFIQNILLKNKRLQYLNVGGDDGTILHSLCNFIESQFVANNKNAIFKSLYIHFSPWKKILDVAGKKNVENLLFRLIDVMNKSVSGNWRVKCLSPWKKKQKTDTNDFDETNSFQCVQRFENIKNNYYVSKTEIIMNAWIDYEKRDSFTVVDKKAVFNAGTREKWIMNCCYCSRDCNDC